MLRMTRIILGLALIAAMVAVMMLRHQEPLSTWVHGSTLLGFALQAAAWLSLSAGVALIATAWPRAERDSRELS